MRRIPRESLQGELFHLMWHRDGIEGAEVLSLPLLRKSPLVAAATDSGLSFEQGLRQALTDLLQIFEPRPMAEALSWEFAIAPGSGGQLPHERTAEARKRSGLNPSQYSQDRQDKVTGRLIRESHRTRALRRLATLLEKAEAPSRLTAQPTTAPSGASTTERPRPQRVRSIRIGRLTIPHAVAVASCDQQQSVAGELLLEFEKDLRSSRATPNEWPLLEAQLLPVLEDEARKRMAKFDDDPVLDLVHIEHRPSTANGAHRYRVGVAETSYYLWAATANSLDRDLSDLTGAADLLSHPTLRERWRCDPSSLTDLTQLPAPAFIGTCTVVIAEEQIIVLERQREHHVAGTGTHFVGEGMIPEDRDTRGRFSVEQTARRGCWEELGIGPDDLELVPTGLIIDTKRWQPLFSFVGQYAHSIVKLEERMQWAHDKFETANGAIAACLPWSAHNDETLALLAGDHPTLSLASNHAQASLLYALYYTDGRTVVDAQLNLGP